MTIAVSTAKCERSFSALKCVKSYVRNSMSDGTIIKYSYFIYRT